MENKEEGRQKKHVTKRVIICAVILFVGWLGMNVLVSLKEVPTEVKTQEKALRVETMVVEPEDYPVVITGYGEVKPLTVVAIASEVTGRVVYTHPSLNTGEIIPKDDVMFQIDPSDYEAALQEADAGVSQWETSVARLKKQMAIDTQRLKTMQRNAQLTKGEYERVKRLYDTNRVGTRSGVDQSERTFNSASDQADQMAQAVSLYPLQIREAESSLMSAKARLSIAETNLSRCTVQAPFEARIKSVSVETGQFLSRGQNVLTLADDTVLEIDVSLDSRDVRKWLQFKTSSESSVPTAWFTNPASVSCLIRWTEDKTGSVWTGTLHRVVEFDRQTRTITVAIRISAKAATGQDKKRLPLVEGMFCTVGIPGRTMEQVYRLPRHVVNFENEIYLVSENNRLKTVRVSVERIDGDQVFVGKGLQPGNRVISTRLIDPLENSLLEITGPDPAKEPTS